MTQFACRGDWLYICMYNVHSWWLINCWNKRNMNITSEDWPRFAFSLIPDVLVYSSCLLISFYLTLTYILFLFRSTLSIEILPFFGENSIFFAIPCKMMYVSWTKSVADISQNHILFKLFFSFNHRAYFCNRQNCSLS